MFCLSNKPKCMVWGWLVGSPEADFRLQLKFCSLHVQLKFSMSVMDGDNSALWQESAGWFWLVSLSRFFLFDNLYCFFWAEGTKCWCKLWIPNSPVLLCFPGLEVTYIAWVLSCSVENPVLFCGSEPAAWCHGTKSCIRAYMVLAARTSVPCTRHWHICSHGNGGLCGHSSMKARNGLHWVFPKESPPCPCPDTCFTCSYFLSVPRTQHSSWRRRKFGQLQKDFCNSLSPHPWLQPTDFWDFPLANSFGRVLQAGFQLVRLCPVCVGAAKPDCGFPVLLDGVPLLSICMGTTSLLCKSEGIGSYARVLQWFTRGKRLPLLLKTNSLAFRSREHPVLEGKGHEQSCLKHLISGAVAKTFDHFPSEGSNPQNCFASIFYCQGKITRFDVSFLEQSTWGFACFLLASPVPNYLKYFQILSLVNNFKGVMSFVLTQKKVKFRNV